MSAYTAADLAAARNAGAEAFQQGQRRAPVLDRVVMAMVPSDAQVGDSIPLFSAWLTGWDTANLAAPVGRMLNEAREP